jgi:hypothetical protein
MVMVHPVMVMMMHPVVVVMMVHPVMVAMVTHHVVVMMVMMGLHLGRGESSAGGGETDDHGRGDEQFLKHSVRP